MDVLVCVGGGGQHIALAVARMVRLGVWPTPPRVLVIDADIKSPLGQRLARFAEPIAGSGNPEAQGPEVPHPIPALEMTPPFAAGVLDKDFRGSFLKKGSGGGALDDELYELFFYSGADTIDIKQGMSAHPSVGAAVFAEHGIKHLKPTLDGVFAGSARVVVASSLIGGTGAGITHQLVKFLHESDKRAQVSLYGAFLLPWLKLKGGGQGAANDVTLINSAKHGLQEFLQQTRGRLTKTVLAGATAALPAVEAHDRQDESVSPIPLLLTYGLFQCLSDAANARTEGADNLFTVASDRSVDWLLTAKWQGGSIAERWAAAKVFESLVAVFASHETGTEFRDLSGVAFKKTGVAGFGHEPNWGDAIRLIAEQTDDRTGGRALAAAVIVHLEARKRQLEMVSGYLQAIFGATAELALLHAGSHKLQARYGRQQSREGFTKAQAYGYLAAAYRRRMNTDWKVGEKGVTPAAFLAKKIDEALMEEIVLGEVIS